MPEDIRAEAAALLSDLNLLVRITADLRFVGIVGEESNGLILYLTGTSSQLARPLSVIVRGASSSGKSFLCERVGRLFPPEVVLVATDLTTNALYYFEPGKLRHRLVVSGERSRIDDDERAEATRALREMIEAGELSKGVPMKDGEGRLVTRVIKQPGPISHVETTTLGTIFQEDANRCLRTRRRRDRLGLARDDPPQRYRVPRRLRRGTGPPRRDTRLRRGPAVEEAKTHRQSQTTVLDHSQDSNIYEYVHCHQILGSLAVPLGLGLVEVFLQSVVMEKEKLAGYLLRMSLDH
jgi:hypothetical protein